jgi:hypothetical protein
MDERSDRPEFELPEPSTPRLTHYEECKLPSMPNIDLFMLPRKQLLSVCHRVIDVEGSIHTDEIARRVRESFNLGRTGTRILDSILGALSIGKATNMLTIEANHLTPFSELPEDVPVSVPRNSSLESRPHATAGSGSCDNTRPAGK